MPYHVLGSVHCISIVVYNVSTLDKVSSLYRYHHCKCTIISVSTILIHDSTCPSENKDDIITLLAYLPFQSSVGVFTQSSLLHHRLLLRLLDGSLRKQNHVIKQKQARKTSYRPWFRNTLFFFRGE